LAIPADLGNALQSALKKYKVAFTPPLPFAEAERKADPNVDEHNTVPGQLPNGLFMANGNAGLRFGRLKPEPARATLTERFFKFR
jgi:hypothetical protein